MGAFEAGLEAAAAFIERNELVHTSSGDEPRARREGNRAGLGYATGIRAMLAASPASPPAEALPREDQRLLEKAGMASVEHLYDISPAEALPSQTSGAPDLERDFFRMTPREVHAALSKPASEPAGGGRVQSVVCDEVIDHTAASIAGLVGPNDEAKAVEDAVKRALIFMRSVFTAKLTPLSSPASSSPAEAEALQAGVEAVFPAYGDQDWSDLADAVSNAIYDKDGMVLFDADTYPGHQMVRPINFNSLNRIVTWFVKRALSSAPAQEDGSKDLGWHPRGSGQSASSECGFPFCSCAKKGVCAHAAPEDRSNG